MPPPLVVLAKHTAHAGGEDDAAIGVSHHPSSFGRRGHRPSCCRAVSAAPAAAPAAAAATAAVVNGFDLEICRRSTAGRGRGAALLTLLSLLGVVRLCVEGLQSAPDVTLLHPCLAKIIVSRVLHIRTARNNFHDSFKRLVYTLQILRSLHEGL